MIMIRKEDVTTMTDEKLLEMVQQSKGHTGEGFKEFMDCNFTYSVLIRELKRRGYVNGWYKPLAKYSEPFTSGKTLSINQSQQTVIKLVNNRGKDNRVRKTIEVSKETWDRWKELVSALPWSGTVLEIALLRFLDDIDNEKIK